MSSAPELCCRDFDDDDHGEKDCNMRPTDLHRDNMQFICARPKTTTTRTRIIPERTCALSVAKVVAFAVIAYNYCAAQGSSEKSTGTNRPLENDGGTASSERHLPATRSHLLNLRARAFELRPPRSVPGLGAGSGPFFLFLSPRNSQWSRVRLWTRTGADKRPAGRLSRSDR